MLDPFPLSPPPALQSLITPLSNALHLPTLPLHIHEVLFAILLYQSVQSVFSPYLSRLLFPDIYNGLSRRTRINWDVHVVSLVQSCLINTLALWVMVVDRERAGMGRGTFSGTGTGSGTGIGIDVGAVNGVEGAGMADVGGVIERVYGYTGAGGLIQGLATGYFVWDLVVSTRYFRVFGIGIWLHAVTALGVFGFGFRPFVNYYGPIFILYELSSPFLNVHWFCDKLNLTGSKLQWYNGMVLLFTFFCCRLVWGTYQSLMVYYDVWRILHIDVAQVLRQGYDVGSEKSGLGSGIFAQRSGQLCMGDEGCVRAQSEVMRFLHDGVHTPWWIVGVYLVSNLTLNALNWYWFGKMIATVRKRFEGKPEAGEEIKGVERRKSVVEHAADTLDREVLTGPGLGTPGEELIERVAMTSGRATDADGGAAVGRRRKDL